MGKLQGEGQWSPFINDPAGQIPDADLKPGILLAVFNGEFKADQGQFGAMVYNLAFPLHFC